MDKARDDVDKLYCSCFDKEDHLGSLENVKEARPAREGDYILDVEDKKASRIALPSFYN